MTNAAGVLFGSAARDPIGWYRDFVWKLSNDTPIEAADPATLVFANQELRDRCRISHFLGKVPERLKKAGEVPVDIPVDLAYQINIQSSGARGDTVAGAL